LRLFKKNKGLKEWERESAVAWSELHECWSELPTIMDGNYDVKRLNAFQHFLNAVGDSYDWMEDSKYETVRDDFQMMKFQQYFGWGVCSLMDNQIKEGKEYLVSAFRHWRKDSWFDYKIDSESHVKKIMGEMEMQTLTAEDMNRIHDTLMSIFSSWRLQFIQSEIVGDYPLKRYYVGEEPPTFIVDQKLKPLLKEIQNEYESAQKTFNKRWLFVNSAIDSSIPPLDQREVLDYLSALREIEDEK